MSNTNEKKMSKFGPKLILFHLNYLKSFIENGIESNSDRSFKKKITYHDIIGPNRENSLNNEKINNNPENDCLSQDLNHDKNNYKNSKTKNFDLFQIDNKTKNHRIIKFFSKFLNSKFFNVLIFFFTIYALFCTDLKIIGNSPKKFDLIFDIFSLICTFFFFIEILLSCLAVKDYFCSFFFFLDIISTFSLILDISWLEDNLF